MGKEGGKEGEGERKEMAGRASWSQKRPLANPNIPKVFAPT